MSLILKLLKISTKLSERHSDIEAQMDPSSVNIIDLSMVHCIVYKSLPVFTVFIVLGRLVEVFYGRNLAM